MTLLIGIAGTHSTGKSTFVQDIRTQAEAHGISVAVVSDTATKCHEVGFPILKDHTFESTLWIMTSVIKAELEVGIRADLVLVDRPVPDALGYLEAALLATNRSISEEQRSYLYGLAKYHAQCYSLILKTQLDESIALGEGRDQDIKFRRDAGRQIDAALTRLGINSLDPQSVAAQEQIRSMFLQLKSN